jgi:hypothetical protein
MVNLETTLAIIGISTAILVLLTAAVKFFYDSRKPVSSVQGIQSNGNGNGKQSKECAIDHEKISSRLNEALIFIGEQRKVLDQRTALFERIDEKLDNLLAFVEKIANG